MDYSFGYTASTDAISSLGVAAIILVTYLLAFGAGIVLYVLQSMGLYTIASRRALKNPWLSWVPVGNMWILGTIADQYRYVARGEVRNRRKVILGLCIATAILAVVMFAVYILLFVNFFAHLPQLDYMADEQLFELLLGPAFSILGVCAVMEIVGIVLLVFEYIALNDLFLSCNPSNNVLFLVLSIVFPVLMPVFVFICRKKDGGMPPRKSDAVPQIPEEPAQTNE